MRKRIQQLARGEFDYARPLLSFSTDKAVIEVLEGRDYTGDFVITSTNHVPMRGVIYTSDPRMECLTPQFEGEEVRIRYQFHSQGFTEGDILKGEFYIICNQGEYNLSFVVSASRLYAETSVGKIRNLNDFARLARENFKEACRLFYSSNFKNIIGPDETRELLYYEGLCRGKNLGQKVDEFLIAIGKKKRTKLTLSAGEAEFYGVKESVRETLDIQRSQWGYLDIAVSSDAGFLEPGRSRLTEEDFTGSVLKFDYYIREEVLHAGRNYGRIRFSIPGSELCFEVCASKEEKEGKTAHFDHREVKEGRVRLLQLYLDYRLKKIVTGVWANRSVEILDHLMALKPGEEASALYSLMKAQALLINRQRQEAAWILDEFKRDWTARTTPEWGYYLYLRTLMEREPSFVDRTAAEIEELFHKNPDSSLLFWILLFVKEEYYKNSAKRWKAIEHWIARGNRSPYFYLEAYYLLWQDPYLLGRLERFETEVVGWAAKQGAVSRDIALQIMNIVPQKREFDRFTYRILEACYQVYPEDEMLSVICGYLIKGQKFETEYHNWYALGIEHELRITSLYEAYLMSQSGEIVGPVPRMIQLYFRYDSHLSYQQRAILFVNIIAGKKEQPEVYQKYRRTMEQFAMEQIEAGHINDNLAVVYEEMLVAGILNEELARKLSGVLFTHKLTCQDRQAARAVVFQKQLKRPTEAPIVNGTAYFQVFSEEYCVILENSLGEFFVSGIPFQEEALMHPDVYLDACLKLVQNDLRYILYHFRGIHTWEQFTERDSVFFAGLLQAERVSDAYKAKLIPEIIRYYRNRGDGRTDSHAVLEKYLEKLNFAGLDREARRYLTELMTELHMYDKAYQMAQLYGYEFLGSAARLALLDYAITSCEFEEDDFLLGFAMNTFLRGKYNDVILIYLCKYYNGPTKAMEKLWKAAENFWLDTFELEERILTQMLYTTEYITSLEQIYESYYAGGGRAALCLAYLSYFAHGYLTREAVTPGHVFFQIEERFSQEEELNDACKMGLMKYFSAQEKLRENQFAIADRLLAEYTGRNIYFAFYRKFDKRLAVKYHLYDKFFVEYHAAPKQRVLISYRDREEAYRTEELAEMYDGIYVREFILFFGESVQYYIAETRGAGTKVTESGCLDNHDVMEEGVSGRYALLNEMLLQMTLEDNGQLRRAMEDYYGMSKVTEAVFRLL